MVSRFRVTRDFETSAPNDLKMALSTKRSDVPIIHVTTLPGSQISLAFTLKPALVELQVILGQLSALHDPQIL